MTKLPDLRLSLILRTAICLEVGLFITFSQSHNIEVGLQALTSFGVGYAMITVFVALLKRRKLTNVSGIPVTILALAIGLVAAQVPVDNALTWFRLLVAGWGILSGAYELFQARQLGFRTLRGKESVISASLGLILGILYLAVPLVALDAVGFFGAYMIVCAVHLGISAASDRPLKAD